MIPVSHPRLEVRCYPLRSKMLDKQCREEFPVAGDS